MPATFRPPLLDDLLRIVPRRYRLEPDAGSLRAPDSSPATAVAMLIERIREAAARGDRPDAALKSSFLDALAALIRSAMRPESGDPVFQAMVLRHRCAVVREFASLAAQAAQDRRRIHAAVNALAHPEKLRRMPPGARRDALGRVHAAADAGRWADLADELGRFLTLPPGVEDAALEHVGKRLHEDAALCRLRRLDVLALDERVCRYRALWEAHGPRAGSAAAAARGRQSHGRGKAVEAVAAEALEAWVRRLNDEEGEGRFRVVTAMRVPASLAASHSRAKTEWDAVLLRRAGTIDSAPLWDVCLLVEAKASVDAATTDLPRLQRGLDLLARAEEGQVYSFDTAQEKVRVRGESLRLLSGKAEDLPRTVLYCSDAAVNAMPRILTAASRMQLLSATAALEFGSALAQGDEAAPGMLEPVWEALLDAPAWSAVLHQYPMLRMARDLMVHVDDLRAAAGQVV